MLNDDPPVGHTITQQTWEPPVPIGDARFRPASPVLPPSNQELEALFSSLGVVAAGQDHHAHQHKEQHHGVKEEGKAERDERRRQHRERKAALAPGSHTPHSPRLLASGVGSFAPWVLASSASQVLAQAPAPAPLSPMVFAGPMPNSPRMKHHAEIHHKKSPRKSPKLGSQNLQHHRHSHEHQKHNAHAEHGAEIRHKKSPRKSPKLGSQNLQHHRHSHEHQKHNAHAEHGAEIRHSQSLQHHHHSHEHQKHHSHAEHGAEIRHKKSTNKSPMLGPQNLMSPSNSPRLGPQNLAEQEALHKELLERQQDLLHGPCKHTYTHACACHSHALCFMSSYMKIHARARTYTEGGREEGEDMQAYARRQVILADGQHCGSL